MSKKAEAISRINCLANSLDKIDRKLKEMKDEEVREKKHL